MNGIHIAQSIEGGPVTVRIVKGVSFPGLTGPHILWFETDDPFKAFLRWMTNQIINRHVTKGTLTPETAKDIQSLTPEQTYDIWVESWTRTIRNNLTNRRAFGKRESHAANLDKQCEDFERRERRYWCDVNDKLGLPNPAWLTNGSE